MTTTTKTTTTTTTRARTNAEILANCDEFETPTAIGRANAHAFIDAQGTGECEDVDSWLENAYDTFTDRGYRRYEPHMIGESCVDTAEFTELFRAFNEVANAFIAERDAAAAKRLNRMRPPFVAMRYVRVDNWFEIAECAERRDGRNITTHRFMPDDAEWLQGFNDAQLLKVIGAGGTWTRVVTANVSNLAKLRVLS